MVWNNLTEPLAISQILPHRLFRDLNYTILANVGIERCKKQKQLNY